MNVRNTLAAGSQLSPGEKLSSNNKIYELVFQTDGNLVLLQNKAGGSTVVWSSLTHGRQASRCVMQEDGSLCIYAGPTFIWGTRGVLFGAGKFSLILEEDGNAVVYDYRHVPVWATNTGERMRSANPQMLPLGNVDLSAAPSALRVGESIAKGGFMASPSKKIFFAYEANGNLTLYKIVGDKRQVLWGGFTTNINSKSLTLQKDSYLVLKDGDKTVWSTQGFGGGAPGYVFEVQDDGNAVIYDGNRNAVWATGTDGR